MKKFPYNVYVLETVEKVLYILIVLNKREIMKSNSRFRKPKLSLASKDKKKKNNIIGVIYNVSKKTNKLGIHFMN